MNDERKPKLVSVNDRDGNVIIDLADAFYRAHRYDSHRVAARRMATRVESLEREPMATRVEPPEREPMATRLNPPADYRLRDDLSPAKGLIFAAALALIVAFITLFF